ncbi:serine/threonine-protein kinase [Nocardiopsis codii]|uniref:serine/threonine-protein kinase n=1 Tax=Nocardiopsis codii TaxID=3065942 RepID=UPI002E7B61BC|nr:protein kinase [Nocardiopsis sp. CT-R113]
MDDLQDQGGGAVAGRTAGNYRLVRSLGRGGFGEVFLGEAPDGSRAAVKLLHASWAGDPEMRRRFTTEVEQARRVSGFCIAAILDADPDAAEPWIATEFIDGPTLQAAVAHDGPRRGVELHRLAISTATALAAIHAAGVVHRDLKPDNIMLAPDGPRVIDFGIARAVETTSVTASGVVGTIGYMAPEQLEGARLTSAVDIFSWGSVMVYAATGREAFPGPTQASRIARILGGEPDVRALDEPLAGIVRSCLDKDPDRRPDATTLLNRLISAPANGGPAPADGQPPAGGTGPSGVAPAGPTRVAPDGSTRVGWDHTRVAGDTPPQVDPTRVAPQAPVDPTRAYTRMAPPASGPHASGHASGAHGTPPPYTPPGTLSPPPYPPPHHQGPATGASGAFAPVPYRDGGVPPYHFHGVRFTDPRDLAEAMQQNWSSAVQVFQDPAQRAALGAWLVDDLGDTVLDRSLFRGHVNNDANLALASFIAQLRPDLPPVFRGRGATVAELGEMFTDPRPLLTGAPLANEMVLMARPSVLRILGSHHGDDSGALTRLADQLDGAERAGNAFHGQLTSELDGWRSARVSVSAALILAFLLHPERLVPPGDGGDRGVGEWVDILWGRVQNASAPADAGYAAVVYGALPTLRALSEQRRHWEGRHSTVSAQHDGLRRKVDLQEKLVLALRICRFALLGLPAGLVAELASVGDAVTGLLVFVGVVGLAGAICLGIAVRVVSGGPARRHQRYQELNGVAVQLPQLTTGVTRINADLRKARAICGV